MIVEQSGYKRERDGIFYDFSSKVYGDCREILPSLAENRGGGE